MMLPGSDTFPGSDTIPGDMPFGASTLPVTWVISAVGTTPAVEMSYGGAAFTDVWTISAVGTTPTLDVPQGAAAFTDIWSIAAEGTTPSSLIPHGSAHFTNEWTIGAVGTRNPQGRASFVDRWTITARGSSTPFSNPISKVLDDLAVCLCAQMEMDGLPPTCFCGVMPGNEVALDYAGNCNDVCGMAWVRLITSYPSLSVGAASERPGNCSAGIGFDVEIGIVRCLDVEANGEPPDAEVMLEAARLQHADLLAMWRAVSCCRSSKDWIIGQYQPYGPEGTMIGGTFPISMSVF